MPLTDLSKTFKLDLWKDKVIILTLESQAKVVNFIRESLWGRGSKDPATQIPNGRSYSTYTFLVLPERFLDSLSKNTIMTTINKPNYGYHGNHLHV